MFELFYNVINCGDGSVSVEFTQKKKSDDEFEDNDEYGWSEDSSGSVRLMVKDNKLFFRNFEKENGKYNYVWKEILPQ